MTRALPRPQQPAGEPSFGADAWLRPLRLLRVPAAELRPRRQQIRPRGRHRDRLDLAVTKPDLGGVGLLGVGLLAAGDRAVVACGNRVAQAGVGDEEGAAATGVGTREALEQQAAAGRD